MDGKINTIKEGLNFPFVSISKGALDGKGIYILVSLENKEDWINGYVENSKYARFCVDNGKIEHFSGYGLKKNFRKCKFKDVDDVINKLNKYYEEVKE